MAVRTDAYLDTSALIAFLDTSDSYHSLFARLFSDPPSLLTSALVIAEGHGWFLRRYDVRRAMEFLSLIADLEPILTIEPFGKKQLMASERMLKRFSDQSLTLADAHGLVLMAGLRKVECWSTDWHLGLAGARLAIH